IPSKERTEILKETYQSARTGVRNSGLAYYLETDKDKYVIDYNLYAALAKDKSVVVYRSMITNAKQRIEVRFDNELDSYDICFAKENTGMISISCLAIGIIIFMILYDRINYLPGRDKMTIFLVIFTLLFFYFHIS
ncbi:MAG: hypothetical protein ABI091_22725, partial [Ferruginibacter sp.]